MARISLDPPRTLSYRLGEWYSRRHYGMMLAPGQAAAHNPRVMRTMARAELSLAKWDTVPAELKELAVLAAAVRLNCSWCMDFGYWVSSTHGLDPAKLRHDRPVHAAPPAAVQRRLRPARQRRRRRGCRPGDLAPMVGAGRTRDSRAARVPHQDRLTAGTQPAAFGPGQAGELPGTVAARAAADGTGRRCGGGRSPPSGNWRIAPASMSTPAAPGSTPILASTGGSPSGSWPPAIQVTYKACSNSWRLTWC